MAVMRVNKTKDYTIMSNRHFKEKDMSLKAKGLLSLMLSLPESWDYSIAGLVAICKENETAIKSTLNELKKFGYLRITKLMPNETESGRIEYVYDIYETPLDAVKQVLEKQTAEKQTAEKQGVENLGVEFQGVENQGQLITKQSITKESNTNKSNINYKDIVDYLNLKAGTSFKHTSKATQSLINARMHEGFTVEDFKTVIDKKCAEWLNDSKMAQYLRPQTLFGTKFESYLNQKARAMTTKDLAQHMDFSDFHSDQPLKIDSLF